MPPPTHDDVGLNVGPNGVPFQAVSLCCYVGPGRTADKSHLYVRGDCQVWYEVANEDIIHQKLGPQLQENGRSAIWLNPTAIVVRCEQGNVEYFVTRDASGNDDPAGGDGSGKKGKP